MNSDQVHLLDDESLLNILKLRIGRAAVLQRDLRHQGINGIVQLDGFEIVKAAEQEILRRMKYRTSSPLVIR